MGSVIPFHELFRLDVLVCGYSVRRLGRPVYYRQIRLSTMYFASMCGMALPRFSYAAAVADTMQRAKGKGKVPV